MYWSIVFILIAVLAVVSIFLNELKSEKRNSISFMESLNLTGLPIVSFQNNGKFFNFLLDTGSNVEIINKSIVSELKLSESKLSDNDENTIFGLDGIERNAKTVTIPLSYKDTNLTVKCFCLDMNQTFGKIKNETGVQIHGILGSKFFKDNKYILNFDELIAYSKKS